MAPKRQRRTPTQSFAQAFAKAYRALNQAQKEAVDTLAGPVVVIAGPGTGKTHMLTLRIANLIRATDTPPAAILALTFTDAAAQEMRTRLIRFIGARGYEPTITTFHGFAATILREFGEGEEVADQLVRYEIMEQFVESEAGRAVASGNEESRRKAAKALCELVANLKKEGWDPGRYRAWLEEERAQVFIRHAYKRKPKHASGEVTKKGKDILARIERALAAAEAYAHYEASLRQRGVLDYEDLLVRALALLRENGDVRAAVRERYLAVLVDEFQDTNPLQLALLAEVLGEDPQPDVFVVGDPEQAIYRFQGAASETIHKVQRAWRARTVVLTENYRSHEAILRAADALLAAGDEAHHQHRLAPKAPKPQVALPPGWDAAVRLVEAETQEDEAQAVAEEIARLAQAGVPLSQMVVLGREWKHVAPVARALAERGVANTMVGEGIVPQRNPAVRAFLQLLRAVAFPDDTISLRQALVAPWVPLPAFDRVRFAQRVASRSTSLAYLIAQVEGGGEAGGEEAPLLPPRFRRRMLEWLAPLASLQEEASILPAEEVVVRAARESGFLAWALKDPVVYHAFEVLLDDVRAIQAQESRVPTLAEAFSRIDRRERGGIARAGFPLLASDVVPLMTVHGAKGREFDVVFLVGAASRHWEEKGEKRKRFMVPPLGSFEGDTKEARLQDERRLFFVALTRGRRGVWVSYAKRSPEYEKEGVPSRFLVDLAEGGWALEPLSRVALPLAVHKKPSRQRFVEWVWQQFLGSQISPTALNNFLEDPWKYLLVSLLRIPEGRKAHLAYGTAVDEAITAQLHALRQGEEVSAEHLNEAFLTAWQAKDPEVWFGEEIANRYREEGKTTLDRWWKQRGEWMREKAIQPKRKFESVAYPLEEDVTLWLKGEVDAWFRPQPGKVVVVDFKTGDISEREKREQYYRQLVFYKLLWELASGGKEVVPQGIVEFVGSRTNQPSQRVHTLPSESRGEIEEAIRSMSAAIRSGDAWRKPPAPPRKDRREEEIWRALASLLFEELGG